MVITGSKYYKYNILTSLTTFISILSKWMLQHTTLQDIHTLQPPTPPSNASTHYGKDLKGKKQRKWTRCKRKLTRFHLPWWFTRFHYPCNAHGQLASPAYQM
jgi:hypothetical protein